MNSNDRAMLNYLFKREQDREARELALRALRDRAEELAPLVVVGVFVVALALIAWAAS